MRESFARFLTEQSSMARVRAALPSGFDPALWGALAELGAFGMRVPEAAGGVGLGLMDAVVLMEEAGRTLASGPIAETLVAARLLAVLDTTASRKLLDRVIAGEARRHDRVPRRRRGAGAMGRRRGGRGSDHCPCRQ